MNKLIVRTIEQPAGTTDMHNISDVIYLGSPTWLSATSTMVKFFTQIQVVTGFTIGLVEQATITPNGNIRRQGTITSTGDLTAPNIYTKTEVDNFSTRSTR